MRSRRHRRGVKAPDTPIVSLLSLGCAKNTVDSERLLGLLVRNGFLIAERPEDSDICLVNTCGFIGPAREETAATLRKLAAARRRGRPRRLVALGCLVERAAALPEWQEFLAAADAQAGFAIYPRIAEFCRRQLGLPAGTKDSRDLADFHRQPRLLTGRTHSTWLKISEGCSHRCAFCSIPLIRGPQVSRPPAEILDEAADLIRSGVREICLVAQDTTAYGEDLGPAPRIEDLVRALSRLEGPVWFRLMYAHPRHLRPSLLDAMEADPRWCRYLDLPLQHIADAMLRRMGRGMGRDATVRLLGEVRRRWPDASLRTSFIVGHPGEGMDEFEELTEFVRHAEFDHVGVFVYSPEAGTRAAAEQDRVPPDVAAERCARLLDVQREISRLRLARRIHDRIEVIVDGPTGAGAPAGARLVGRHRGQAPEVDGVVYLLRSPPLSVGSIVSATVADATDYDLIAHVGGAAHEVATADGGVSSEV